MINDIYATCIFEFCNICNDPFTFKHFSTISYKSETNGISNSYINIYMNRCNIVGTSN